MKKVYCSICKNFINEDNILHLKMTATTESDEVVEKNIDVCIDCFDNAIKGLINP